MGKTHKTPSRKRYEEKNPNWTARLPKELHDALNAFLGDSNLSRREFMGVALKIQKMDYERVRNEWYDKGIIDGENNGYSMGESDGFNKGKQVGYKAGHLEGLEEGEEIGGEKAATEWYEKGKKVGRIWYYCAICGKLIPIDPNSPEHHFIIDMMRQNGWRHPGCNPYW